MLAGAGSSAITMREIKFRAWMNGKMYQPAVEFAPHFEITDEVVQLTQTAEKEGWALMQFTGLHDKNGKEIWEGDMGYPPAA